MSDTQNIRKFNKSIGIVIPVYNEEKNIVKLVKIIQKKFINSTIFIVDDSSHKKAEYLIKKNKLKVKYVNRGKKLGRGSAVIFGFKKLIKIKKINIFVEMDADFSHHPAELPRNISFFHKNSLDLLIGSRYLKKSRIINWSLSRRIFSILANYLAKRLLRFIIPSSINSPNIR